MAIYRLLQNPPMGPGGDFCVNRGLRALKNFGLVDRSDLITRIVAKKIIEIGQRGVRDPEQLSSPAHKVLAAE